jgi:hypothetical protein
MQKPSGYDTAKAETFGEFKGLSDGPKICVIINAYTSETASLPPKPKIVFELDISSGEEKSFFAKKMLKSEKTEYAKVHQCTEGPSTPYFKGRIAAIEHSNPGYKFDWNENSLRGKLVGCMFQLEEYVSSSGEVKTISKPQWFFSIDKIAEQKTPSVKKLPPNTNMAPSRSQSNSFSDGTPFPTEPNDESDLPWKT